ncbi:unnamed protein product [Rotaria socialis]|uniref:Hexosyltransferase n=1 Tax=Rotaria socialis TaxID=392032 RepID=A0A818DG39_9BILA|nr:unnamed protein product [Rotaria socialis]CAF3442227.1 unnamed protein product [Rotaria socialis]CAF3597646.1 unnamed protein product [Rotaria socialis]CAF4328358.1 unnamed protein product [Rotaria socialis]CAF4449873.1 unnamed protein product [Rotaria socialis]
MELKLILLLDLIYIYIDISKTESNNSVSTTTTETPIQNPYEPKDRIVNPHNFSYLLNPGYTVCNTSSSSSSSSVYILVYVHSGPTNYQRRIVIRETWATQTLFPELRLVFMIGKTLDKTIMKAIEYENEIYQDIVQEDFIDAYKNLTYKGIMALKWVSIYCSQAKYILKVDDDIVTNTFTLTKHLKFLDKLDPNRQQTLLCLVWHAMIVMRDSKSKWYLSKEEFPLEKFPPYCSGSAYIFTGDMAAKMYNASLYVPFFWVDDYYITGAVASAANVTYTQFGSLYTISEQVAHTRFLSSKSFYTIMFGHFPGSMNHMREIWRRILIREKFKYPTIVKSHSFSWDETIHPQSNNLL